jgi:hypothetical protein
MLECDLKQNYYHDLRRPNECWGHNCPACGVGFYCGEWHTCPDAENHGPSYTDRLEYGFAALGDDDYES